MECFNARGPEGEKRPLVLSARPRRKKQRHHQGKERKTMGEHFEFFPHFFQNEKGLNRKRNRETLTEIAKAQTQILVQRHEHCC
jgi:hypothetical protein